MHERATTIYGIFGGIFGTAATGIIVDVFVDLLPPWWMLAGVFSAVAGAILIVGSLTPIGLPGTPPRADRAQAESGT